MLKKVIIRKRQGHRVLPRVSPKTVYIEIRRDETISNSRKLNEYWNGTLHNQPIKHLMGGLPHYKKSTSPTLIPETPSYVVSISWKE